MTERCTSECVVSPPSQAATETGFTQANAAFVQPPRPQSPPWRHPIVLMMGVFLCLVVAALLWLRPAEYGLLYGKLLESDATRLSEALASLGIDYTVTANRSAVYVPKQKVRLARLELARKGIAASPAFTFDLISAQSGPRSTTNGDYLAALERELAATLACLPGVNAARVLIQVPGNRGRINGDRAFALVVVQTEGEGKLSDEAVRTIQILVSSTTDLVTAEQVAVAENPDGKALAEFNPDSL